MLLAESSDVPWWVAILTPVLPLIYMGWERISKTRQEGIKALAEVDKQEGEQKRLIRKDVLDEFQVILNRLDVEIRAAKQERKDDIAALRSELELKIVKCEERERVQYKEMTDLRLLCVRLRDRNDYMEAEMKRNNLRYEVWKDSED